MPPIEVHELVDLFGRVVDRHAGALFVGAGLSMQAGLPSWPSLVAPLADQIGAQTVADMPLVAEYYVQNAGGDRGPLKRHLLDELSKVSVPSKGHALITRLHVSEIWTTNFDPLIELAADPRADVINLDSQTSAIGTGRQVVIKMHGGFAIIKGTAAWESSPVITRGDFERYEVDHPRMWSLLQASYLTRTMLFLGFSFADPNVELLLRLARRQGTARGNHHLAVLRRPTKPDELDPHRLRVNDLEDNGITVCEIDKFEDLVPLLEALQRRTRPNRLFVAGSGENADEERWCDDVGVALARHRDWQIASLSGDAGWWTTRRVAKQRRAEDTYRAEDLLLYFRRLSGAAAPRLDDRAGTAVYTDLDRHPLVDNVIAECRAMVVIGGGDKTREEVAIARSLGVGVVPLAASGTSALEAWHNATDADRVLAGRPAPARTWQQLNDPDNGVAIQAMDRLLNQAMYGEP